MGLNPAKGNMYDFVSHTWNAIKGACSHDCSYCYMKRWGALKPAHLDERELRTDLGNGNFIFVGSSCDMFASDIDLDWILKTMNHMRNFDNKYLLQTKNPTRLLRIMSLLRQYENITACTTIESDIHYPEIMGHAPHPIERAVAMRMISEKNDTFVTIEPIMEFDLMGMVSLIDDCHPKQVNIGADSGRHGLPEPSWQKIAMLISELQKFTKVVCKPNLKRLDDGGALLRLGFIDKYGV